MSSGCEPGQMVGPGVVEGAMDIDDLIREKRVQGGNLPGLLVFYAAILALMVASAFAIA